MKRYFDSNQGRVINTERLIYPINKKGFMVPSNVYYKILPIISDCIDIIAIFNQTMPENEI